jgi:GntR family transcriptional repressor for pyruvate dehydrogenase complex
MAISRQSIEREKLSQRLAREIVEEIASQGLQPGQRLEPESVMLARYGVGRATMREALRILEDHGLIVLQQGHGGPMVSSLGSREFGRVSSLFCQVNGTTYRELGEMMLVMEPVIAAQAAERIDAAGIAALAAMIQRERDVEGNFDAAVAAADEFHYLVADLSGNSLLSLVASSVRDLYDTRVVQQVIALHGRDSSNDGTAATVIEHEGIAKAISEGKVTRAETLMRAHVEKTVGDFTQRFPDLMDQVIPWN